MDPLWIGAISLAILIVALVLAYLLLYKEQSFEDAVASQKASSDILIQNKQSSGRASLKHRKKPKKERTKSEGESEKISKQSEVQFEVSDESENFPKSLADEAVSLFEENPEKRPLAESSEEDKPIQKHKKRGKDKRRSDHHRVGVATPPSKEQERVAVKEDVLVQESFEKTDAEQVLEGLPPMVEEEPLQPKEESVPPASGSGKKPKKSKAPKDKQSTSEPLDIKELVKSLEGANLNHDEIQKLVDVLLDKQKSADQWKKTGGKPDPMDLLRKQLTEKEEAYKEEHSRAESLAVKMKELREEHVQGLTKQKNNEAMAAQKIQTLEKENEALQMRMTASHKNNALEHEKLVAALEKYEKKNVQAEWDKLQDDLARSQNQKTELEARILTLEADVNSRKEHEDILVKKAADADDLIKNFEVVKNSLSQQLMETVKSKSESEQRLKLAKTDAEAALAEKTNAVQKAGVLQSQLDEEISKKSELEKMYKALEGKMKDADEKHALEKETLVRQAEAASGQKDDTQMTELKKQSEEASRQVDELKAKLAQAEEDHGKTKQSLASKEEQLNKHEGEICNLKTMNSSKDEELELLRKTVSVHENEIVVIKNNMSQELQAAPPEVDDTKVKSLEEEIERLTDELNERKEQMAASEKSIDNLKAKNNELREKNWKAMDALSAAEKQHKVDIGKTVRSGEEENKRNLEALRVDVKEFLCRIHPTLSVDKDLSYEDFLKKYECETEEISRKSSKSESNDSKAEELEAELKKYIKQNDDLTVQCSGYKISLDSKENELKELLKKSEEYDSQCNKYKSLLGSTETMLHELEDNVEQEIASLKVTVESKDAEIEKANTSLSELKDKLQKSLDEGKSKDEEITSLQAELSSKASLGDKEDELKKMALTVTELRENLNKIDEDAKMKELKITSLENDMSNKDTELKQANTSVSELENKLQKAVDEGKSKDDEIASLQAELSSKASLGDKEDELKKMTLTVTELRENFKKSDEDAKMKELRITSLESDLSNKDTELKQANSSVVELKESVQKASDESKSKDGKINSLQLEISTLKTAAATSSDESKSELKKLSAEVERLKTQEKALRDELEAAKNAAKLRAEEDKSPELEKYKNEANDAAKANTELRRELEEVRIQNDSSKSPKKKHDKESDAKIRALEEKLAQATKKESELLAKISHLEDSTSTTSLDEDASPDSKEKKKKRGFSLMGSKSSKYETKYRDMSEKYEQVKSESDEKSSKIAQLEAKLQNSEKALQAQEEKVKELKAQVGLANGGVQNTSKPLNESQIKQMAEAMKDGDPTGAV